MTKLTFEVGGHVTCEWTGHLSYKMSDRIHYMDLPVHIPVSFTLRLALKRFLRNNPVYSSYLVVRSPFTTTPLKYGHQVNILHQPLKR